MKRITFITAALFSMSAQAADLNAIRNDYANRMLARVQYVEQQQQLVWPGFHPASTPATIIYEDDDGTSAYAFNFKPGQLPWQKRDMASGVVYVLPDASSLDLKTEAYDQPFLVIDGQRSFIDFESTAHIKMNENISSQFMYARADYFIKYEGAVNPSHYHFMEKSYDSFNNIALMKLLYLEDAALTLSQQADNGRADEALRDAIAIRQYRQSQLTADARAYENGLEILRGVPNYISWTSQQLSDDNYRIMTQRTGCPPLSAMSGQFGMFFCYVSDFPAYASAVYGRALDKQLVNQPWKQDVTRDFRSIPQIAVQHYHLNEAQARSIAELAMLKPEYRYERIERVVDNAMSAYVKNLNMAKANYQALTGIEVNAPITWGFDIYEMLMRGVDALDANYQPEITTFLLENLHFDSESALGMTHVKFNNLPFASMHITMNQLNEDLANSSLTFKVSEHTRLVIDGVAISAADFVKQKKVQSFQRLDLTNSQVEINITEGGALDATSGKLQITDRTLPMSKSTNLQSIMEYLKQTALQAK